MKLLICTQKVDRQDTTLGFFHRWIIEFAKHFESVTVICLYEGEHDLPEHVKVLSLGKERGKSHPKYILRFYKYVLRESGNYDSVLVHMNQEYILLGGLFWKLFRKKVYMWRNHYNGSWLTDVAAVFCSKVFCTSRFSYTAKYKKTVLMPVGIDTNFFTSNPTIKRTPLSILSQGRISPSKNIHIFIEVLGHLKKKGKVFTASIYGDPLPKDTEYYTCLKKRVQELELSQSVTFYSALRYNDLPNVYSQHQIFVNLSPSGMYDKTMFEAAACGCVVVALNKDLEGIFGSAYVSASDKPEVIAEKITNFLSPVLIDNNLREITKKTHDLVFLGNRIAEEIR